jgi:hypothetical protein
MDLIVIEHVKVSDLPEAWRALLADADDSRVTVRIEKEAVVDEFGVQQTDSAFGMWADREDVTDVRGYLRRVRAPRY